MKKPLIAVAIIGLLTAGAVAVNYQLSYPVAQVSSDKESVSSSIDVKQYEGKAYNVKDMQSSQDILSSLGVGENESFEIFSLSCVHCYNAEPVMKGIEEHSGEKIHRLQLGFDGLPLAEIYYSIEKLLPDDQLDKAKEELYMIMLSENYSSQDKVNMLNEYPSRVGITNEQMNEVWTDAQEYAKNTRALALSLDIRGTPTLYIAGENEINLGAVKNEQELYLISQGLISLKKQ